MRNLVYENKTIYSPEVQERAVRLYFESLPDPPSDWATILSVSCKIGCTGEPLRRWIKRTQIDQGSRDGVTTDQAKRFKELKRENRELKRANEILRKAAAFFAQAEFDRQTEVMVEFIDKHRKRYDVEPICAQLPIAPSIYYRCKDLKRYPDKRSYRARRDIFRNRD